MTQKLKIGLLSAWTSRSGGGVFEAVVAHCAIVRKAGFEPIVLGPQDQFTREDRHRYGDVEVHAVPMHGPANFSYAPQLQAAVERVTPDILHLHGIWAYPSVVAASSASRLQCPYVISPHGMLDPWILGRGRARKHLARLTYEGLSWSRANIFHALTGKEAKEIEQATGRDEIVVTPNAVGASTPPSSVGRPARVLYLGRIHPKKNLRNLVEAWRIAAKLPQAPPFELRIVGWGAEADVKALRDQIDASGCESIKFLGPRFGREKEEELAMARYLLLPSLGEGLPMAILEAWGAGTPTLMSRFCNLDIGFERQAALDTGIDVATISAALGRAFGLDLPAWHLMSTAAVALVEQSFSISGVAGQWRNTYETLLSGQSRHEAA